MGRMMKNKRRLLRMMRSVAPEMHTKVYGKSTLYERSDSAGQWREVSQAVARGRWPVVRQAVVRKAIPLDIPIGWAQARSAGVPAGCLEGILPSHDHRRAERPSSYADPRPPTTAFARRPRAQFLELQPAR